MNDMKIADPREVVTPAPYSVRGKLQPGSSVFVTPDVQDTGFRRYDSGGAFSIFCDVVII
jgi:hypothetical protein